MDCQEEFTNTLYEFLNKVEMVPLSDELNLTGRADYRWSAFSLTAKADYHHLCFMKTYYKEGDETPYQLLVPIKNWHEFLTKIGLIFGSKINRKLIQRLIGQTICQLKEFPFTEEMLQGYAQTMFEHVWKHYELTVEALVPLHNIVIETDAEIQLANSVLCPSSHDSIIVQKANHPDVESHLVIPNDKCFLRIQVTGDDESRLQQVEREIEKSLAVLRFVTMWLSRIEGTKRIKYNPAAAVNTREQGKRYIVYHKLSEPDSRPGFYSDFPELFVFRKNEIDSAYKHFGLEDLNFHFGNQENPISRRIIRSLNLYDSGLNGSGNWQALYRYVVSINVIFPRSASKGEEIVEMLTKLIQYGGYYVGSMKKGSTTANPETLTWEDMVELTAEPFKTFYLLRGKILHGNLPIEEISDEDTEDARELAHNAIRAMAFLARQFNWQNDKEAYKWFKSPSYPPSLTKSAEV